MKKRKISMAEVSMTMKRTFIQPLDISSAITYEEIMQRAEDAGMTMDPELAWELFKVMNGPENVFGKLADIGNVNPISPQDLRRALNNGENTR